MKQYWLMKSEPDVYSIDDMKRDGKTLWTGVRNYQARNYMMGDVAIPGAPKKTEAAMKAPTMAPGDEFLFYHSNAEPPGVAGIGRISKVGVPDPEQFNKKLEVFEPKATKEKPVWFCSEVEFVKKFDRVIPLDEIRSEKSLAKMVLLQKGSRLSVQPVLKAEFERLAKLSQKKP